MQIRQKGGPLSYGSAYKLFFVGWVCGWALLIIPLFLVMVIMTAGGGTTIVNGEAYSGPGATLAMLPMIIFFPVFLAIHGLIAAAAMTAGIWLYRRVRPITVSGSEDVF